MHKEKAPAQKPWNNERLLRLLSIVLVLALIIVIFLVRSHLPNFRSVGYIGVFVLSLVSSASVLVPAPGIAAVCAGPGLLGLLPLWVALLASVAESLGELTGYLVGFGGRGFAENNRFYPRVKGWMQRRGGIALFLASSVPNPLFDLVGVAAGTLRYPVWRFLVAVWAGKLIKSTTIAYACFYGFEWALRFFGLN